jgi:hypothetical protein
MEVSDVVEIAVQGILEEQVLFAIPHSLKLLLVILNMLPIKLQEAFRDIVIRDKEYKLNKF